MDHYTDLCYAIQDLIDSGLVNLGQPSVIVNSLPTHVVPPPTGGIHFTDIGKDDDRMHMLSWEDIELEPIILDESQLRD